MTATLADLTKLLAQVKLRPTPKLFAFVDGTVASGVIKRSPGSLVSVYASSINAALRYLQFFDDGAVPASGRLAKYSFIIPAGSATGPTVLILDSTWFGQGGVFDQGIAWGISTAAATYTAATITDHTLLGQYV